LPYNNDKIAGVVKNFHQNGKLASTGKQYGDRKESKWFYYDEKGKKIKTEVWKQGKLL
jgi:antitoxin component YwqK of YwqJK toxin-antitoxin module